jgi:hypothetical protein
MMRDLSYNDLLLRMAARARVDWKFTQHWRQIDGMVEREQRIRLGQPATDARDD